jgi:hypothetical protein
MEDTTNNNMTTTTTAATVTTTLVTHMSADRGVWLVGEYCRRWHPHTMPVQRPSIVLVVSFESEAAYAQRAPAWDACPHMEVVAVVNDGIARNGTSGYPVNLLRNLVLARVRTSHVLVLDADFLPSVALADDIRDALQVRAAQPRDGSPEALVVPVFAYDVADPVARQVFWDDPSHQASRLPGTFDELLNCTQERVPSCTVFHATQFPPGHSTTQTERWLARDWDEPSRHGRDIRHIHCLKSTAWEPYVVVPWCSNAGTVTPFFDERFQNYGFNKIQWINHIRLLGFRFFVLPQGTCWFRSILKVFVFDDLQQVVFCRSHESMCRRLCHSCPPPAHGHGAPIRRGRERSTTAGGRGLQPLSPGTPAASQETIRQAQALSPKRSYAPCSFVTSTFGSGLLRINKHRQSLSLFPLVGT